MTDNKRYWKILARNNWQEIIDLSKKKTFQRKFQLIEAFIVLVGELGLHKVTHADIAQKCKVTRQLVDHHFPTNEQLILMTYHYVYARFQKVAADAVMSHKGALNQLKAYINAVSKWVFDYSHDSRFLAQFFALAPVNAELRGAHKKNLEIGNERIKTLFLQLKEDGEIKNVGHSKLDLCAHSIQLQIAGFVVLGAGGFSIGTQSKLREELLRCCMALINL